MTHERAGHGNSRFPVPMGSSDVLYIMRVRRERNFPGGFRWETKAGMVGLRNIRIPHCRRGRAVAMGQHEPRGRHRIGIRGQIRVPTVSRVHGTKRNIASGKVPVRRLD